MTAPTILEAEHRPTAVALAIMAVESRGSKRRETLLEFIRRFELWIGREGRRGRREREKKKEEIGAFHRSIWNVISRMVDKLERVDIPVSFFPYNSFFPPPFFPSELI